MADFWIQAIEGKRTITYEQLLKELETKRPEDLDEDIVVQPTYMTEKAVGADVFAERELSISPNEVAIIPTGLKAIFPMDYGLFAFIRSSIPDRGLILANGVGVIDADYYENPQNDGNIGLKVYNYSDKVFTVNRFDRIGQLAILPIKRFPNAGYATRQRGASGSTGK